MSNSVEKSKVKELLIQRDLEAVKCWIENSRNPQRVLFSLAYDPDELVRWRAIETIGRVAVVWSNNGLNKIKNLLRQQFWMMNDESGGLGWHSPEIIGEILVNVPQLIEEFGPMLLAFLDEEPFERGAHLAVCRVAAVDPKPFVDKIEMLIKSLEQSDNYIQAYTIMALGEIDPQKLKKYAPKFDIESEKINIYNFETGQMEMTDLKQIVRKVIHRSNTSTNAA